jgi:hypothetical protein
MGLQVSATPPEFRDLLLAIAATATKTHNAKVTGSPALSASPCGLPGSAAGGNEERDGNE